MTKHDTDIRTSILALTETQPGASVYVYLSYSQYRIPSH